MPNPVHEFGLLDVLGCVGVGVASVLAVTVGLGGGSLYMTCLMVLMDYNTHESTELSQCMMAGASCATTLIIALSKHPFAQRPMLNLDLSLFIVPLLLSGTVLGVVINRLIPPWAIIAILIVVMFISNYSTVGKAISLLKRENLAKKAANLVVETDSSSQPEKIGVEVVAETKEGAEVLDSNNKPDGKISTDAPRGSPDSPVENVEDEVDNKLKISKSGFRNPFDQIVSKRSKADFIEEERKYSIMKWILLVALWSINFVFSFFRGSGEGTINLIEACSLEYWLMIFFSVFSLVLFGTCWFLYLNAVTRRKKALDFDFIEGDLMFDMRTYYWVGIGAFAAGVYGGTAGVGGSVIQTPILLYLSVSPQIIIGVSASSIFLASSTAATIYLSAGVIPYDVAALLAAVCFVSSFVGKYYLDKWVKEHNSPSTLLFIFVVVLFFSILAISVTTILEMVAGTAASYGPELLCGTAAIAE